jgi:hypothetical protein
MAPSNNRKSCAARRPRGARNIPTRAGRPCGICWANPCWAISLPKDWKSSECHGPMSYPSRCVRNRARGKFVIYRAQSTIMVPSLSPLFHRKVRLRSVGQCEPRGDVVDARAGGEPLGDVGLRGCEQRRRQREQHQRAQGDAFFHQLAHRHDRRAVAVGGVDRDRRIHANQFQRGLDIAPEIDVDDAVDAALSGERQCLGDDVLCLVVDDEVGAGKPRLLRLGRGADGRDHLRAAPFRELHCVMPDRAGAAGDQHRPARDRSIAKQAAPRGHAGNAQRRSFGKRQSVRQRRHQMLGKRNIFGRGAEGAAVALAVEQPDALTSLQARGAVADLIDDPGAVTVRNHPWVFHRAIGCRRVGRHRRG